MQWGMCGPPLFLSCLLGSLLSDPGGTEAGGVRTRKPRASPAFPQAPPFCGRLWELNLASGIKLRAFLLHPLPHRATQREDGEGCAWWLMTEGPGFLALDKRSGLKRDGSHQSEVSTASCISWSPKLLLEAENSAIASNLLAQDRQLSSHLKAAESMTHTPGNMSCTWEKIYFQWGTKYILNPF